MKCERCWGEINLGEPYFWITGKFSGEDTYPCTVCRRLHFIKDSRGNNGAFLVENKKGKDVFLDHKRNALVKDDYGDLVFLRE